MEKILIKHKELHERIKKFAIFFCLVAIVIFHNNASGQMNTNVDLSPGELSALPRWCQVKIIAIPRTFGKEGAEKVPDSIMREYAKWENIVGKDMFIFTHHYCRGLNWINRYKKSLYSTYKNVDADRKYALKQAEAEFRFMRNHLRPKHKIYTSMLMNEAYLFQEKGDIKSAIKNYKKIIKVKPNYARAYVYYAQLLNSMGMTEDATKVLQIGLKKTNGSGTIKRALVHFGGENKK